VADKEEFDSTGESTAPAVDPRLAADAVDDEAGSPSGLSADALPDLSADDRSGPSVDEGGGANDRLTDPESRPAVLRADEEDQISEPNSDDLNGDKELVTVGAPAKERTSGAISDRAAARGSRLKKEKATPKQKHSPDKQRRTGPVTFVKESVGELRKVVYPTGQQLINYFVVVLIFVLFIIALVSLLDLGFGAAIIRIFS
jgi:preprotein translocase subunit SecE